jgi:DNA-binding NarL/FixJ family response regulator
VTRLPHQPSRPDAPPRELTCVVVEDQGLFLEMLGEMLNMRGGLRVLAGAHTVAEGKTACKTHNPDLLILDLDLPDGDGTEVARALIEWNPAARVIIVSGHIIDFICPAWLRDNLQATISKNATFSHLRAELDELLDATHVRPQRPVAAAVSTRPLSRREAEIFGLIGEGLSTKEIAARLFISEDTIKTHRKNIARKLGTVGLELIHKASARGGAFKPPKTRDE